MIHLYLMLFHLLTSQAQLPEPSPLSLELQQELQKKGLVVIGDMILPEEVVHDPKAEDGEIGLRYVLKSTRPWPGGIVYYQFAPNISTRERSEFLAYCAEMSQYAKVSCQARTTNQRNYIYVEKTTENVCGLTYLGMVGGRQPFKIRCWRRRTIQHELMHAFGVSHEHNRMDRDEYITVLWDNIQDPVRRQFFKVSLSQVSLYLNYYDFDSILHYDSYSGSSNGQMVFFRNDTRGPVRQSERMSFGDHYTLYALCGGTPPRR